MELLELWIFLGLIGLVALPTAMVLNSQIGAMAMASGSEIADSPLST